MRLWEEREKVWRKVRQAILNSFRDIIGQVNGLFDPPGFAAPVTVAGKILVRKLWIGKMKELGWDDPIPESLRQ